MGSLGGNQLALSDDQYRLLIHLIRHCSSDQRRRVEGMITILDTGIPTTPFVTENRQVTDLSVVTQENNLGQRSPMISTPETTNATENGIVVLQDMDRARHDLSGTLMVQLSNSGDTDMNDDSYHTSTNTESLSNRVGSVTISQMTPATTNLDQDSRQHSSSDPDDMNNHSVVGGVDYPLGIDYDSLFQDLDDNICASNGANALATTELASLTEKYQLPEYSNVAPEIITAGYVYDNLPSYAVVFGLLESGKMDKRLASQAYRKIRKSCQGFPADKRILCYKLLCHLHKDANYYQNGVIPTHVNQLLFVRFDALEKKFFPSKIEDERIRERSVDEKGSVDLKNGEFVANLYIYIQLKQRDLDGVLKAEPTKICRPRARLYESILKWSEEMIANGIYRHDTKEEILEHMNYLEEHWTTIFLPQNAKEKRPHKRSDDTGGDPSQQGRAGKKSRTDSDIVSSTKRDEKNNVPSGERKSGTDKVAKTSLHLNTLPTLHDTTDEECCAESTNSSWIDDSEEGDDDSDSDDDGMPNNKAGSSLGADPPTTVTTASTEIIASDTSQPQFKQPDEKLLSLFFDAFPASADAECRRVEPITECTKLIPHYQELLEEIQSDLSDEIETTKILGSVPDEEPKETQREQNEDDGGGMRPIVSEKTDPDTISAWIEAMSNVNDHLYFDTCQDPFDEIEPKKHLGSEPDEELQVWEQKQDEASFEFLMNAPDPNDQIFDDNEKSVKKNKSGSGMYGYAKGNSTNALQEKVDLCSDWEVVCSRSSSSGWDSNESFIDGCFHHSDRDDSDNDSDDDQDDGNRGDGKTEVTAYVDLAVEVGNDLNPSSSGDRLPRDILIHSETLNDHESYPNEDQILLTAIENGDLVAVKHFFGTERKSNDLIAAAEGKLIPSHQVTVPKTILVGPGDGRTLDDVHQTYLDAKHERHEDYVQHSYGNGDEVLYGTPAYRLCCTGKDFLLHRGGDNQSKTDGNFLANRDEVLSSVKYLNLSVLRGHSHLVEYFLIHRKVNARNKDMKGKTALHYAARGGQLGILEFLIRNGDVDIEAQDRVGRTPLHEACKAGNLNIVLALLAHKAQVDRRNDHGWTALFFACQEGHLHVAKALVQIGLADVNALSDFRTTALHRAIRQKQMNCVRFLLEDCDAKVVENMNGWKGLHIASGNGSVEMVTYLIKHAFAGVEDKTKFGMTALHFACLNGRYDLVTSLTKDLGANVEAASSDGFTPLLHACSAGHLKICEYLLHECRASPKVVDSMGRTALHISVLEEHEEIVKVLINHGEVDVKAVDNDGHTAIALARLNNHGKIEQYLAPYNGVQGTATLASRSGKSRSVTFRDVKSLAGSSGGTPVTCSLTNETDTVQTDSSILDEDQRQIVNTTASPMKPNDTAGNMLVDDPKQIVNATTSHMKPNGTTKNMLSRYVPRLWKFSKG